MEDDTVTRSWTSTLDNSQFVKFQVTQKSDLDDDSSNGENLFQVRLFGEYTDISLIAAIAIFAIGGILMMIGFGRLIYYYSTEPKKESRRFQYVIRYTDLAPEGKYEYPQYKKNPVMNGWI